MPAATQRPMPRTLATRTKYRYLARASRSPCAPTGPEPENMHAVTRTPTLAIGHAESAICARSSGCDLVMCPRPVTIALPASVVPGQAMTRAMLTNLPPPGRAFRSWLCLRWMTSRIHQQWPTAAQQSRPDRWAGDRDAGGSRSPATSVVIGDTPPPEHAVAPGRVPARSSSRAGTAVLPVLRRETPLGPRRPGVDRSWDPNPSEGPLARSGSPCRFGLPPDWRARITGKWGGALHGIGHVSH